MSELRKAADEARKLVKMLRSVEIIADTFDSIANIESLTAEVNNRLLSAQSNEQKANDKLLAIKSEGFNITKVANEEANRIINEASIKAAEINKEAKLAADDLVEAKRYVQVAFDQVTASEAKSKANLIDIEGRVAARNKELFDVEMKILRAKEQIQSLFK